MEAKRNVIIITDGAEKTAEMAAGIASVLSGNDVNIKAASEFQGNDLLPADVFFIGCEKPKPDSFAYLTDLLEHINLAGRPCGVFTPGEEETVKYLTGLVHDCEAALNPQPLFASSGDTGGVTVTKWAKDVVGQL